MARRAHDGWEIIEWEGLVQNSARMGQLMMEAFTQMQDKY